MFKQNLFAVVSATFASSIALTGSAEAASMFSLNLDGTNPNNTQTLNLESGKYAIELLGIADGGLYDAWTAWRVTSCPDICDLTSPTTFTGWLNQFWFASSDITSVSGAVEMGTGNYFVSDGKVYNTAAAANTAFSPVMFSLGSDSMVDFEIRDFPFVDNSGGLTLKISQVSEPGNPIPEPTSTFSLLALGILGAVSIKRRKGGQ
ncbi:MAG: PEP-CTERM sorting domain-containing protein [Cyanobacteriota bacterium]|nr:PEP-CTERM sorting domain-containing protein [Cyanobacteriota bacterium]